MHSPCPNCQAAAERLTSMFTAGCPGCAARAASRSPQYRRARDTGTQDRHYRALLELYGVDHAAVKAASAADFEQRATA